MIEIKKLRPHQLEDMAKDYVAGNVFADVHVKPYRRDLILSIFPAMAEACSTAQGAREIAERSGMVCALLVDRIPGRCVRAHDELGQMRDYHIFKTCMFVHKDQLPHLQRLIALERERKRKSKKPRAFGA